MGDGTKIEWTDATWNPITGCSVVSPGCTNCYAMRLAGTRLRHHSSRAGLTQDTKAGPVWTGEVRFNGDWLDQPIRWRRPRRIFVCAHGDLFHEDIPEEWIDKVFAVMALAPQHQFQVLTKRARRMADYLTAENPLVRLHCAAAADVGGDTARQFRPYGNIYSLYCSVPWPLQNVWLGVSVEDQKRADERLPDLIETPAAVRFVSYEPALGQLQIYQTLGDDWIANGMSDNPRRLHWVIAGGESGPGARPAHPDWFRRVRDDCRSVGVAFFMKQMAKKAPIPDDLLIREFPR